MKKQLTLLISFPLLLATQLISAQSTTVSGLIYDQSGRAIPKSNFREKILLTFLLPIISGAVVLRLENLNQY
ncbi:hypothetical protein D0809_11860 [Flavobacterium circumlabens]|uniref:Uncharacterized protein n=1 Tax=Flavobacterium circumlabens TaxID=2133765 RepID=A0A4Y7UDD4_9FLAO|nr:hypothetical protein [Flavobacterium circumlabens]TCN59040.1 hypothetical protein EV142_103489 [Flavobacterium circumlabens]TEB44435.1 hypothetical protein D0809_11860 [Flavobacterium circumlabens]